MSLTRPQRDLLVALLEHGAVTSDANTWVSVHGLTRGNASGNKLTHALKRGSYGPSLKALGRKGLVESKFSSAAGVDLWRLTVAGAVIADDLTRSLEGTTPLVVSVRGRLSGLAERRAVTAAT